MADSPLAVFISYRRNVSSFIARAVFQDLRQHGYDVFMDVESLDSGEFSTIILNQIAARAHFLVILTPGTLERCQEPGDWLMREIETALALGRNVVPILVNDFRFDESTRAHLTGNLQELPRYNALTLVHDFFDEAMARLRLRFLKQPAEGVIKSPPRQDEPLVQRKIEAAASQSTPTKQELSAEDCFNRGIARGKQGDMAGAIADCTEALRLNPQYAAAYANRGVARGKQGDMAGAIADYTEALRLDPQYADASYSRGIVRERQGDMAGAIADYTEALRLDPQYADASYNRGVVRERQGDRAGAIADYTEAIRLNPQYADAYVNRGIVRDRQGDQAGAIADFTEAIRLNPQYATAYVNRGVFRLRGDLAGAIADYTEAIRLNPQYADAYYNRGIARLLQGSVGGAVTDFRTSRQLRKSIN